MAAMLCLKRKKENEERSKQGGKKRTRNRDKCGEARISN